jgi:RHS repeat-associated protein
MPYLSYDPNGNILALRHQGLQQGTTFGQIDDLKYTYSGNRLLSVTDASAQSGPHDFQDHGATTGLDYGYNANGSLVSDANKGITAITYNHLDLPEKVTLAGGKQIVYLYDAAACPDLLGGTKLAQVLRQPFTPDLRTDYVGEFVYQSGVLEFFGQPEGRCVAGGTGFRYEYHYRDHLGNLRLAFSDLDGDGVAEVSEVLQEAAYYPYGMRHEGLAAPAVGVPHRFLFQGKELEGAFGVDWMDFGARRYDAAVGRWWGVDAMAGRRLAVSPYAFVQGKPVGRVDPTGMLDDEYDQSGRKISDLGGDKIDFFHQADGNTKIVDRENGASNIIKGGEALIRGYEHRKKDIGWGQITEEFLGFYGPTKSLIADFDDSNVGAFGSLDRYESAYSGAARTDVLGSTQLKDEVKLTYREANPMVAMDMWEQMWGRSNISWYKLGEKTLFFMADSKSATSLLLRLPVSWERQSFGMLGNTYQTYIWTECNDEVAQKSAQLEASKFRALTDEASKTHAVPIYEK